MFLTHDPTQPSKKLKISTQTNTAQPNPTRGSTQLNPTQPNPTSGSTQPMDDSVSCQSFWASSFESHNAPAYKFNNSARGVSAIGELLSVLGQICILRMSRNCYR